MKKLIPVVLFLSACDGAPPEIATAPAQPDSGDLFVRCGTLIDGLSDEVQHDRMVVIQDGRIAMIVAGDAKVRPSMTFLDLSDKTCLPGLTNTHAHLDGTPEDYADYSIYYTRTTEETNELTRKFATETLMTGFTTIWNLGAYFPEAIYLVDEEIEAGSLVGPRILNAGPYLTIPKGGGDLYMPEFDESEIPPESRLGVARGPEEFAKKTQDAIDRGADLIKVIASGAVFSFGGIPGAPEMTEEEIAAVVEVAHAAGLKVTAHVHSAESGKDAVRAGVDTFEHASLLDDEAIAMVAEAGIALSMDVYNGTYTEEVGREQGYPEEFMRKNYETTEAQRVVFEKAYAAGIPILYGTDSGVHPHHMGGWQFDIMVERGMAPMDAIRSATSWAANHMGTADDVGAIQAGRYGDLIAVSGNPLDDMKIMRDVDVVIKGGLVFKNESSDE
ncbi:MAG: amidohydrolase family protein [Woeseiaceae bacterium]